MTQRLLTFVRRGTAAADDEHERVFIARYDALRAHAKRLVAHDRSLADDLIQDAYIQFTLTRPDLGAIVSLDAYLAALIRNLHISGIRRTTTPRVRHVAIEDYESADLAMALAGPEDLQEIRRSLIRVCEYGCLRKERSKAAGILLLRFFHGFYPAEIAQILRSTPRVVNDWLWKARREARLFVDDPTPAHLRAAAISQVDLRRLLDDDSVEIVSSLQAAIFSTSPPPCPTAKAIARWYGGDRDDAGALDVARLSHVAGCRECLNRICRRLGMASVDQRPPGDRGGPDDVGGGAGSRRPGSFEKRARQRARDVREHRPRQLQISVNGYEVGVLGVESARNDVRWTIRPDEPIAFTEVHSEQGLRLALLHVERPPDGDLVQRLRIALSDGRYLSLAIDFSGIHPALTVTYVDPELLPEAVRHPEHEAPDRTRPDSHADDGAAPAALRAWWTRLRAPRHRPRHLVPIASVPVLVACAAWWSLVSSPATPSVPALFDRAVAEEQASAPAPTAALHRTLAFDMRRVGSEVPVFTHRIDVWAGAERGTRALRVFDRTGHLVAGQWTTGGHTEVMTLGVVDDVWQAELSAIVFRDRYALVGPCTTTDVPDTYTVTCERPATRSLLDAFYPALHAQLEASRPARARLTLRKPDFRVLRLALTLPLDGVDHVVTIEERERATVPLTEVPPDTFAPDPRPRATPRTTPGGGVGRTRADARSLEVRLVDLVDRLAASDLLSVRHTGANDVIVAGLVSGEPQKRALLDGIAALDRHGTVTIDVRTFDEAARGSAPAARRVQLLESAVGAAPLEAHVRTRVPDVEAAVIVRELTPRVLAASGRLRRHALALDALLDRFDERARDQFDRPARASWSAFVRRQVTGCATALEELDALLAPYFDPGGEIPTGTSATLAGAVDRLAQEAATINEVIATMVTAPGTATGSPSGHPLPDDLRRHIQQARRETRAIGASAQP